MTPIQWTEVTWKWERRRAFAAALRRNGRTYRYIAQKLQIGEERARQITAKKERCIAYQVNHGIADDLAALEQQLVVWKRSGRF
jgi:hypothetical protein